MYFFGLLPVKLHVLCRYPYLVSPDTMDVLQNWINADNSYTRSMQYDNVCHTVLGKILEGEILANDAQFAKKVFRQY